MQRKREKRNPTQHAANQQGVDERKAKANQYIAEYMETGKDPKANTERTNDVDDQSSDGKTKKPWLKKAWKHPATKVVVGLLGAYGLLWASRHVFNALAHSVTAWRKLRQAAKGGNQ